MKIRFIPKLSLLYRYGSVRQSPVVRYQIMKNRISQNKILQNIQSHKISHQLINNLQIALNCTKIAIRYSKCYFCKLSLIRYPLKQIYRMGAYQQILGKVQTLYSNQCPMPSYKLAFERFHFQNKGIFAALSLLQTQRLKAEEQSLAVKFLTALQLVNLGFSLHHSIGIESHKLNFLTRLVLKMMSKQMKDSYLVLGGDYFHIKGSRLASQTNDVKLSKLLSQVQINLCKYIHLTQKLKNKIIKQGYDTVDIKEIFNISVLKTSPIVKGLMSIDIIKGLSQQQIQSKRQVYQIIGLLMLYRKDLENFMFNFKDILKKYIQYKENRISFDSQQSLPYFIFYQGAKDNKRIDTSYLNTVTMMSEQIEYLKQKLESLIGQKKSQQLLTKMNYFLTVYS